jgi:2-polyprenyl-3-methyl-5-hydroxy-6-metoxy-1,4-benzoquinol methylase
MIPREFVWAVGLLAAVCVLQTFNPQLTSRLVALVGFRILLLYIPLFVIGMTLAQRSPLILERLTWLVLITSLPICIFGIWEWFQGPAGVAALGPGFARSLWIIGVESGTLVIYRPSSTFAFVGQFGEYLLFVTALAFGALHATRRPRKLGLLAAIFVVALASVLLAGGRTSWFELPVLAVAMYAVYLMRERLSRMPPAVPLIAVGTAIGIAVGLPILRSRLPLLARGDYLLAHLNNFNPFHREFFTWQGLIGHGTGSGLGAARYVNGGYVPIQFEGGWYIPLYMFGVLGLAAYLFLYGVVLRLAWFGLRTMTGDRRWLGAAIFCYLVIVALLEGAINYPPANVFFWLFAGLLAGQAVTQVDPRTAPPPGFAGHLPVNGEEAGARRVPCPVCGADAAAPVLRFDELTLRSRNRTEWRIVRCSKCGMVYVNPRPQQSVRDTYGGDSYGFVRSRRADLLVDGRPHSARIVSEVESHVPVGSLLDVGCATGDLLLAAQERGWRVHGVEVSPYAARVAAGRRLEVTVGLLRESHLPEHSFDAVTLLDVIEHLEDPHAELSEMRRLLRPGGVLCIETPNWGSIYRRLLGRRWAALQPRLHILYFDVQSLRTLLQRTGFEVVEAKTEVVSLVSPEAIARGLGPSFVRSVVRDNLVRLLLPLPGRQLDRVFLGLGQASTPAADGSFRRMAEDPSQVMAGPEPALWATGDSTVWRLLRALNRPLDRALTRRYRGEQLRIHARKV